MRDPHLQKDILGAAVTATSWWEGGFHKTRMEGGAHGAVESWRSIDAGLMVVKTTLKSKESRSVSMIWYLEEMAIPGKQAYFSSPMHCAMQLKVNPPAAAKKPR